MPPQKYLSYLNWYISSPGWIPWFLYLSKYTNFLYSVLLRKEPSIKSTSREIFLQKAAESSLACKCFSVYL